MKVKFNWLLALAIFCMVQNPLWVSATLTKDYAILPYGTHSSAVMNWITDRFSHAIGGKSAPGVGVTWTTYVDATNLGSNAELLLMKDWATVNSVLYEDVLLHAKTDFTYKPQYTPQRAWSQMDKFDNFEGAKGVMRTSDNLTYTDLTATAYSGSVTWQNTMYVGYEEAFDQINLIFSTPGSGVARVWEYWNGSAWATLSVTDGTSSFTNNGQILFTPPSNWSRTVINSSRNKYFVRCRITAASANPVTSSVKGDTWLRGGDLLCRGWDSTSGSIVNSGELAYNPTPPAGASAKFRYQSRVPMWNDNHFVGNPADIQNVGGINVHTWAKYVSYAVDYRITTGAGQTGVMLDDGVFDPSGSGVASTNTDFVDKTSDSWMTSIVNRYHDITLYTNATNPSYSVGINSTRKSIVLQGNFNLAEWYSAAYKTWNASIDYSAVATDMSYDDYLPAHNPTGVKGLLGYTDPADTTESTPKATWDRANRGPIACLSHFLVGKNANTVFWYDTHGATYGETDEVILKDGSTWYMATQGIPALANVRRWSNWFPAMGVDFGIPDVNGYNGGVRNLAWKPLNSVGDVMPVFRRDYTKAVVLHRPGAASSTQAHYDTFSISMALGGTYYPLSADGTTGPALTSIALRTGEGAILMKEPIIGSIVTLPPPGTTQPLAPKNLTIVNTIF